MLSPNQCGSVDMVRTSRVFSGSSHLILSFDWTLHPKNLICHHLLNSHHHCHHHKTFWKLEISQTGAYGSSLSSSSPGSGGSATSGLLGSGSSLPLQVRTKIIWISIKILYSNLLLVASWELCNFFIFNLLQVPSQAPELASNYWPRLQ